ncbi:MAG: trypsin-like peptidase domain-containing protein [Thermoleophilia bacterium]|nr:trypsin-like peptidase domain-containing protein [Thermoleophilia bacterium]
MTTSSTLRTLAGLVTAAVVGAAAAVGAVALLGGFEGSTTVVRQTVEAPRASSATPAVGAIDVAAIYERAAPGVVQITSTSPASAPLDPFGGAPAGALGSGFVIDKAGHIVTNYHVVRGAGQIRVSFSNRDTVEARIVGTDPSTDLAVLQVDADATALTPLPLGDSDEVRVGDPVVAIGNPFGLTRTVTAGIVSAVQRLITAPNQLVIDHVIQTDAPINRGNSGGPLLNARGQVIGVNTQIETGGLTEGNVGIGFAVPSNTVKEVVAQILKTGRVDHAYLGIVGQTITRDLVEMVKLPVEKGVLVHSVRPGSGAAKAGLRPGDSSVVVAGETYVIGGDIIVGFDGKPISSIEELREAIAERKPGDEVRLEIYRDGEKTSVTVTLGRPPPSPQG